MLKNQNKYRIEVDFLGEKEIPADAYYGVQTMRAVENFPITGYKIDESLIKAFGIVKKAAALANYEIGQLPKKIADVMVKAADELIEGKLHDQIIVDPIQGGAGTSINMNINEVIANRALELIGEEKGNYQIISPNTHVNMSQSTNDAFPTAMRLSLIMSLQKLLHVMDALYLEFIHKSEEFDHVIKMGRTHLQDAVPIRLGQEFAAYGKVIKRDINRLNETFESLIEVNMGATAIGTGLNADPEYIKIVNHYLAQFVKFPIRSVDDFVDGTQNTDIYLVVSSALKNSMMSISKIANDLRLMASGPRCGLGEINLPPRQPGSSIMPGKVNPVMAEVVNQSAFHVAGNDLTVSMACEAGQFELNVMEPVIIFNILESIKVMTNVLTVFRKYCVSGISANEAVLNEYVNKSIGLITAINPHVGYEKASQVAREALETMRPIREIILERNLLTEEELNTILDPMEMTNPGIAGKRMLTSHK